MRKPIYPYWLKEIICAEDSNIMLGIEEIATGRRLYMSALQLFHEGAWITKFSPQHVRAIAGFAHEELRKKEQEKITRIEKIHSQRLQ